jgi:hypothetical protein
MVGGAYICRCSEKFCSINHTGEYYPKPDADAEIARLEHQIEVLNSDLTRCQDSKTAIGDKCLRLESENAVLRERLTRCTQDNFELCQDSAILTERLARMVEASFKNGFNYGFGEGMKEARPYSKGGISAVDAWPKSKTFKDLQAIAAAESGKEENRG